MSYTGRRLADCQRGRRFADALNYSITHPCNPNSTAAIRTTRVVRWLPALTEPNLGSEARLQGRGIYPHLRALTRLYPPGTLRYLASSSSSASWTQSATRS